MRAVVSIPAAPDAAGLAQIARIKALAALGRGQTKDLAVAIGSPRVQKALGAMTTNNSPSLTDINVIVSAFVQQLANESVFFKLLDSMHRVPFQSRVSMITSSAAAHTMSEGRPVPVADITLNDVYLKPLAVSALIVLTEELLNSTQSEQNINNALRRSIAAAADATFFASVVDADTPTFASAGATAAAAVQDLKLLLDAVQPKSESSLLFAMSPEVQRSAATLPHASGGFIFPSLTPLGGSVFGIPAMPCDQLAPGSIALVDAAGLAGEAASIDVNASDQASLEIKSSGLQQNAKSGAGTSLVSMFQTNSVALKAATTIGVQRLRDNAIAIVTSAGWAADES